MAICMQIPDFGRFKSVYFGNKFFLLQKDSFFNEKGLRCVWFNDISCVIIITAV